MFGGKKLDFTDQMETIIGKETQFKGNLTSTAGIRIDGNFEGEIVTGGDVVVGESGKVTAHIQARNLVVAGEVVGNLDVTEKLELMPSGKLHGDMKIGILIVGEGALFTGACSMRNE